MGAEADARMDALDPGFVEALHQAFMSLAKGQFERRLSQTGARTTQDAVAGMFNDMAKRLGELFNARRQQWESMEALIASVTDALVGLGAGEFEARVPRSFNGGPEDVLAYMVNNAAEEIGALFAELEHKNALLEDQASHQAMAERAAYTTLSAGVGHELNNPLSYALCNLEFIQAELQTLGEHREHGSEADPARIPDLLEAAEDALEGVVRAARIAADLKNLTPSVEMEFGSWQPRELIEPALALVRNAVVHRARLRCHYDEVPNIRADRGRIGQVLVNLVQNALLALPDERPAEANAIDILVSRHSDRLVAIEVRDNGEGITPHNLTRIFDSFFSTRPLGQGLGLGLALCKRMIADHDGRIDVRSTLGQGTSFHILLPIVSEICA